MSWFAFDIEGYDADTMHLSAAEDGIYCRLIRFYYKTRVPLPDNDKALAAIARVTMAEWEAARDTIRAFFKPRRGKLTHKRCDAELDKEDRFSKSRSQHATKASHARSSYINKIRSARSAGDDPEIIAADLQRSTRPDQTIQKKEETNVSSKKALALDDEMRAWAAENAPHVDLDSELSKHLDWKRSKGRRYADQRAGFRNWLRTAEKDALEKPNGQFQTGRKFTPAESLYAGAALAVAEREAQRQHDRGEGDDVAEPLLDGSGRSGSEEIADPRLAGRPLRISGRVGGGGVPGMAPVTIEASADLEYPRVVHSAPRG
jgi:uncharacterized protein YdaU (DUF1376 family)